ncbi:MAG: DUF4397 domain-containing protein [Myxococcales bacterium]|nr:DUF4397 domain-containing protein [Myxococcales bacterium]MCB9533103.1 DUF4397 domain-containing protein [Myxococcales bacterium]
MTGLIRRTSLVLALGAAAACAACGDDGAVDPGTDAGTDTVADGTDTDTGIDIQIDEGTDTDASTCESGVACVRTAECVAAGVTNGTCEDGCCVAGTSLPACTAHLDACEDESQGSEAFVCDTTAGLCLARCDFDNADSTQSSDCPLNSYCLVELTGVTDEGGNGACVPGDCDSNIFDEAACGGAGTCLPVGNGASFCVDAGTAAVGDVCNTIETNQPASDICQPGLLCFLGECVQPCNRRNGDADCEEGVECLGVWDITPRNQPGWCGGACPEFSSGECGDGSACGPILGRFGINEWVCQPRTDVVGVGEDCDTADCDEGLICVGQGDGVPPICLDMCDPLGDINAAGSGCPGEPGAAVFGPIDPGATSDYSTGDALAFELTASDDTQSYGMVAFERAAAVTTNVIFAGTGDTLTQYELVDSSEGPDVGLRLVNVATASADFTLSYDLATVAAGTTTWTTVGAGDVTIDGTEQALAAGSAYLFVADGGAATLSATYTTADAPAAPNAGIVVLHGIAAGPAVDVYVGCTVLADCTGDDLFVTALAAGAHTDVFEFPATEVGGAPFMVVPTGTDPATADASVVIASGSFPAVTAGTINIFAAIPSGVVATTVEFVTGEASVGVLNAGAAEATVVVTEVLATGLLTGDEVGGSDGTPWMAVPVDSFTVRIQAGDIDDGFLIEGTDGRETLGVSDAGIFGFDDTRAALSATTGRVRVVNARGAALTLSGPGSTDLVCTPSTLSGFGFCQEGCEPYPRRPGAYDCEDPTDICIPFVATDARPVEPQGTCSEDDGGTAGPGEACSNAGFLGGDCADFAVCLSLTDSDADAQCLPLCEPFSTGGCADYPGIETCSGIPPLVGQLNFSFCTDAQPGTIGGRCSEEGLPCADDNSICLDFGDGPVCWAVCRAGFDDCAEAGGSCETGNLNPEVVPTYMGLCQ